MRDLLLEIGSRPAARRLVGRLGLPLPLPQTLKRARGPWQLRPLADQTVVVGGVGDEDGHVGLLAGRGVAGSAAADSSAGP